MKIINPIYDKAFKYLMQNERLAKRVLEVILDKQVVRVSLEQQETIAFDQVRGLHLFRLDFKATIKDNDGKEKTVLIEMQKSKRSTDIIRFRNYLGASYMSEAIEDEGNNKTIKPPHPIIAIYFLGYKLKEIPYLAVRVDPVTSNAITNKRINIQSDFVDFLTHHSYILQVRRLPKKRQTLLEKFLSLFDQTCITDKNYILDLEDVPEEFRDMVKYLSDRAQDPEFRRQLAAEEEIDVIFDQQERDYELKIREEQERARIANQQAEIEKQRAETEKQRAETEKQRAETERIEKEQKQKELEAEKKNATEFKRKMILKLHNMGDTTEEIAKEMQMSIAEIKKIVEK